MCGNTMNGLGVFVTYLGRYIPGAEKNGKADCFSFLTVVQICDELVHL